MANYPIGRLIAEMRNRQGLSQEELASEICSVSTLSKIENGAQMPKRKIYEALLQRLGIASRNCTAYISEREMRRCILEAEIDCLIAEQQYDPAWEILLDYIMCRKDAQPAEICRLLQKMKKQARAASVGEDLSRLELQYVLYQIGVLIHEQKGDREHALAYFEQAIEMTVPKPLWDELPQRLLLSRQEISILCRIAMLQYEGNERREAKRLLFLLKEYMELRVIDPAEKSQIYPKIMHLLAHWMGEDKRYDRQIELCDLGIDSCIRQMKQCALPRLLEEKGYALAERSQTEQAKSILKQAYFVYCAIGESDNAERLRTKVKALFQIDVM